MKYLLINTNTYNGTQIGVNIFYASPIKSGEHIGKFATSENALLEFPDIFKTLEYSLVEIPSSAFEVNFTPPTLSNEAVEIPLEYQLPFVDGFFRLNDFAIPLETYQNKKIVNVAYFLWKEFRAELDTLEPDGSFKYKALKDSLMKLWDYFANEYINGRTIKL
jgi:FAD/FMN-containing dehydrogenase